MVQKADYYAFGRLSHHPSGLWAAGPWDLLLSAYEDTQRVQIPFERIPAKRKQWFVQKEYDIPLDQYPDDAVMLDTEYNSPGIEFVRDRIQKHRGMRLCIDSTGFIRPHLLVLLRAVKEAGIQAFDVLYSDPVRYIRDEHTEFTLGPVVAIRQVPGYEGVHNLSTGGSDILVIGAGYDVEQITRTCDERLYRRKYVLTGLPSLQPHMYQESVLQIEKAAHWIGELSNRHRLYASANQPFGVAQVLHDLIHSERRDAVLQGEPEPNFYLCPIGPKPHALGFALYYLRELQDESTSILYPFVNKYPRRTSEGILRTWQYVIEL